MRTIFASAAILGILVSTGVARAGDHSFDSNGVRIRYLVEGEGPAVVLIHGFLRNAEWMKDPLTEPHETLPGLAEHYRVIALDCRGHGKSGKPYDPKQYGPEVAEDVIRLLDHLGVKKAHVVGYSMGAGIAGKLLAAHPDRLLSVTFGGSGPLLPAAMGPASQDTRTALADSIEQGKGMGPLMLALTPPGRPKPTEEQMAASKAFLKDQDVKALAASLRADPKGMAVSEAQLRANKVPVLFVYGDREFELVKHGITEALKLLPGATVKVIEGADHGDTFVRPEYRRAILEFLNAHGE